MISRFLERKLSKELYPPPVRGRTGHTAFLRSARAGGCTPGMPASCLRQGRKGHSKAPGADAYYPLDQARRSAAGPWPDWPSRLLAFRKGGGLHPRHAGFLPAARPERAQQSPRRGRVLSSRSSAALSRRCVAARAMPPSCVPQGRKGPRETSGAHALSPFDEARALARRSKARRDSGGTPPRIVQREHPLKKGPFAGSFFAC